MFLLKWAIDVTDLIADGGLVMGVEKRARESVGKLGI